MGWWLAGCGELGEGDGGDGVPAVGIQMSCCILHLQAGTDLAPGEPLQLLFLLA